MRLIGGPNTRVMTGNSAAITQTGANVSCVTQYPHRATGKPIASLSLPDGVRPPQNSYNCNPGFDSGHKRSTH
jgi:hypothetical protein